MPTAARCWLSTPTSSSCSLSFVNAPAKSSTDGLFRFGTVGVRSHADPRIARPATNGTILCLIIRLSNRFGGVSEARVDTEPDLPARGIRGHVLEAAEVLIAEVRHLGIQTRVAGPGLEVATEQLEADAARDAERRALGERRRELVGERDFAELHEAGILGVDRLAAAICGQ